MLTRLTHAAIAFAVTAAMYQGYVLAVVPFVEPEFATEPGAATEQMFDEGRAAPDKYRDLLAAYFPPDHWCLQTPPIAFENGQAMVVLDKYEQKENGETRVPHCAIVFFPRPLIRGAAPPRDAIVLEPSGGALLQMEQAAATAGAPNIARSKGFGRMQFGQLVGEVSVRSDMREPGPEDDMAIVTRDLYMNEDGIRTTRTDEAVTMQLGQHFGRGRGLEIRFLQAEPSRGEAPGALYGKLDSLKILSEVSAEISPGSLSVFQSLGDDASPAARAAGTAPIRIQSDGPFRIEFAHYVATFTNKVRLRQIHADGKLDQLLAEELHLNFAKNSNWNSGPMTPTGAALQASFSLEPASIIATGTPEAPVSLSAPSQDAAATGGRLYIELTNRRLTLDTGEEVMLRYRGAEIYAPMVSYELPPKGSASRLGKVWASGGGRLDAVIDPQRPNERLEVRWTDSMRIIRRQDAAGVDQPVLVLDGRPRITLSSMGTMWADRLEVFLREGVAPGASQPATTGAIPANVQPERITASGRVAIKSNELTADVNQLDIKIDHSAAAGGAAPSGGAESPLAILPKAGGSQGGYEIKGVVLQVTAAMRDRRLVPTRVVVDGAVDFKETPTAADPEGALRILAERLIVAGADTPDKEITIHGGGGANGLPPGECQISARGARLRAAALTLRTGSSQAEINSPGVVELTVDRDLTGQPLPQPELIEVTWQEAMRLDRDRLTFTGDVRVQQAAGGWLRTQRLVVQMTKPVQFDAAASQEKPQVAQLECAGGAKAEFDQRDANGVTSRQHIEVQTLAANQVTGVISGDGPGFVDSVHLSRGAGALLAIPGAAAAPAGNGTPTLRHLHIDFVRGVGGNLHSRTVNVHGDVKAVYGPVEDWADRLAMTPGGRPGPETVWIACEQLGVTESPAGRLQNPPVRLVELEAQGRVQIEGQDPKGSNFSAIGSLAKYDQSKGMFILEGNPATIDVQQLPGAPRSPYSAEKMTYWQETGRVQVHRAHAGQINVINTGAK